MAPLTACSDNSNPINGISSINGGHFYGLIAAASSHSDFYSDERAAEINPIAQTVLEKVQEFG